MTPIEIFCVGLVEVALVAAATLLVLVLYFVINTIGIKIGLVKDGIGLKAFLVATVFISALVIRICVLDNLGVLRNANNVTSVLYYTFAGFQLEGQDIDVFSNEFKDANKWMIGLYYGSGLWFAFSFIMIVTVGISYKIHSIIVYSFLKRIPCINIYAFAYATEDSVTLADSIKEKKKCSIILFSSDELGKFDKDNEIHLKIKDRGYLYINLPRRKDGKNIRIFDLTLLEKIIASIRHKPTRERHLFAFKLTENGTTDEASNADLVFDDIEASARWKIFPICHPIFFTGINYHILSSSGSNGEYYDRRAKELFKKKDHYKRVYDKILNYPGERKLYSIDLVGESLLAGIDLLKKAINNENKNNDGNIKEFGINFPLSAIKTKDDSHQHKKNKKDSLHIPSHRVKVLGFGLTGQFALDSLYIATTSLNLKDSNHNHGLYPYGFEADVYDKNITKMSGIFNEMHPSYDISVFDKNGKAIDKDGERNLDTLKKIYNNGQKVKANDARVFEKYLKLLPIPKIKLYEKECNTLSVLNEIDNETEKIMPSQGDKNKGKNSGADYSGIKLDQTDYIIIALGDDESNINIANAILHDLRQEKYANSADNSPLTIFVHIRNSNNMNRLLWDTNIEENLHPSVKVRIFGDSKTIFSYENIVDYSKEQKIDSDYAKDVKNRKLNMYTKVQNRYLLQFMSLYEKYKKNVNVTNEDYLLSLEHERFIRTAFALGCVYIKDYNQPGLPDGRIKDNYYFTEKTKDYIKYYIRMNNSLVPNEIQLDSSSELVGKYAFNKDYEYDKKVVLKLSQNKDEINENNTKPNQ